MSIHSIGIIGLGSFGQFLATLLPKDIAVTAYDVNPVASSIPLVDLAELVQADAVILAAPLSAYKDLLQQMRDIPPETLLIDVCSVKSEPERLFKKHLPRHQNVLLTHPLFGPIWAAKGTKGHELVITKSSGQKAEKVIAFCEQQLGLATRRMTSEAHDRAMAGVHALTFFIARALHTAHIADAPFKTPSFQMLLDLVAFDQSHSDELFQTIQRGNPFAADVRRNVLASFNQLEAELES